jgi:predicted permease
MLARAAAREQELSVRAALGASRTRLVRQLLTESLALGLLGGLAGLLIAAWATDLLVSLEPRGIPRLNNIGVDLRVAAFTGLIALATSITFGLLPAFQMTRGSLVGSLRERGASSPGGLRGSRLRGALVVAEMALAVLLLIGAGLLLRSFANLMQVDPGFRRGEALTFRVALPGADYGTDDKKRIFYESLLERMRAIPGVTAAAATMRLPMSGDNFVLSYTIEGRPPFPAGQEPTLETRVVTAGYVEAMGMRIVRGRAIEERDNVSGQRVVLLSERAAREQFSYGDPIGQKIMLGMVTQTGMRAGGTVVGIVADVHEDGLAETQPPQIYVPHAQFPVGSMSVVARTAVPAASITPQVRALLAAMDPKLPMAEVRTLEQQIARSVDEPRFYALLLGSFAALALSLAAIGIFGVMSYQVSSRTREIGIRLALGAQRERVMRMVLTQALSLGGLGVVIGLAGGWFLTKYLASQLFELTPTDPVTFGAVAATLLAVALIASWMPARRATRVDPMVALRGE